MKHYLLIIYGGVEATVLGPYHTNQERLEAAKKIYLRKSDAEAEFNDAYDNLFYMDSLEEPVVGSFCNVDFEESDDHQDANC